MNAEEKKAKRREIMRRWWEKNPNYNSEYKRGQYSARSKWISDNGPCRLCGSSEKLEIDHIDPSAKSYEARSVWFLGEEKRSAELAKCQVICRQCHIEKSKVDVVGMMKDGSYKKSGACKLTADDVLEIRRLLELGKQQRDVAAMFGVHVNTVHYINVRRTWSWLDREGSA